MLDIIPHGQLTQIHMEGRLLGRPTIAVSAYLYEGVLIDSGMPTTGAALAAWFGSRPPQQILLSHHHEDHIGGAYHLAPHGMPILAPGQGRAMIAQPRPLPLYRRLAFGQPRGVETRPLPAELPFGPHTLRVIPTPGHAPDHVVFLVPQTGWLFGADLYVEPRGKYLRRADDLQQWYDSIKTVLACDFGELYCAHAGYVRRGRAALREKIDYWEELAARAQALRQEGLAEREIRQRLLGREKFLTYWSGGVYSKLRLVRALLKLNTGSGTGRDQAPARVTRTGRPRH